MSKRWLVQGIILAQAGICIAFGFHLAYAFREIYIQQLPMIVSFGESRMYPVMLLILLLVPMAKGICGSGAVVWWLAQQRKIIEKRLS